MLAGDTFTVKLESYFADANLSDFGIRITDVSPMSAEDYAAYLQDLDENPWLSHIVNGTVEITGYRGLKSEATVPAKLNGISVTSIANRAFAENRILTHVTVENGVLRIGAEAFMNCMALAQIDLPDSITEIGESAFFYCPELTELHVPAGVTAISDTFACNCEKLAAVTLPQNLESIGENAFSSCTALTEIEIPATVTKIGSEAFGATGLTSVSLPHGITTVASSLFGACEALTEVSLPETVTEIERFAFSGCAALTEIQLPAGLKAIRNSAFAATGLETVTLPEGLETVEKYAFHNSCLTAVAIPSTVREIGINPFSFCHSMTEITVAADNPQYKAEENCLLSKDGTTLLACLSGFDGVFTVPDGVTAIGQEACSGALMTGAVIPETVTELGLGAFTDSKNLKSVDMHAQVTAIPESCFMNCTALEKIHLPQTLTSVDRMAFYSCNNLKTVHYAGTQAEWDGIDKARGTPEFTVHFLRKTSTLPSGTHSGCQGGLYCSECDEILCGGTEIPSAISAVSVSESGKITIAPQTGETARIILAAYRDGWLAYAYTAELRGGVYEIQTKELSDTLTWKVFFVDETCVPVHSAHLLPLT